MKNWTWVALILAALLLGGCTGNGDLPMLPVPEGAFNFMVADEMREAAGYYEVTKQVLNAIEVNVVSFDGTKLCAYLSLNHNTAYQPRNLQLVFDPNLYNEEGMSERGWGYPHDCNFFNDCGNVLPGVKYTEYVEIEVEQFPINVYGWGLFGPDSLAYDLVWLDTNDYGWPNADVLLGELNGNSTDTGLNGLWPIMSGNAEYVACFPKDGAGQCSALIKNMVTGNVVAIDAPVVADCAPGSIVWGSFSYDGSRLILEADYHPNKAYLMDVNPDTGEWTWLEGSDDGSYKVMAGNGVFSANGKKFYYMKRYHPVGYPPAPVEAYCYDVDTGNIEQVTFNETPPLPYFPPEIYPSGTDFSGRYFYYRYTYLHPIQKNEYQWTQIKMTDLHKLDTETGEITVLWEGSWWKDTQIPEGYNCDEIYEVAVPWAGDTVYVNFFHDIMLGTYSDVYKVDINTGDRTLIDAMHNGQYKQCLAVTGDGLYVVADSYWEDGIIGHSTADDSVFTVANPGSWSHTGVGS